MGMVQNSIVTVTRVVVVLSHKDNLQEIMDPNLLLLIRVIRIKTKGTVSLPVQRILQQVDHTVKLLLNRTVVSRLHHNNSTVHLPRHHNIHRDRATHKLRQAMGTQLPVISISLPSVERFLTSKSELNIST